MKILKKFILKGKRLEVLILTVVTIGLVYKIFNT